MSLSSYVLRSQALKTPNLTLDVYPDGGTGWDPDGGTGRDQGLITPRLLGQRAA